MGLTDEKNEGTYEWRSGTRSSFNISEHWHPGQPTGRSDENCIEMKPSTGLNDYSCTSTSRVVCQNREWSGKFVAWWQNLNEFKKHCPTWLLTFSNESGYHWTKRRYCRIHQHHEWDHRKARQRCDTIPLRRNQYHGSSKQPLRDHDHFALYDDLTPFEYYGLDYLPDA